MGLADLRYRLEEERFEREAPNYTFFFRTTTQRRLWEDELRGQISDGFWENSSGSSFVFWSLIPTGIGSVTEIVGGPRPDSLKCRFDFMQLLKFDVVRERMLEIGRRYDHPTYDERSLRSDLRAIKQAMADFAQDR